MTKVTAVQVFMRVGNIFAGIELKALIHLHKWNLKFTTDAQNLFAPQEILAYLRTDDFIASIRRTGWVSLKKWIKRHRGR